MALCSEKRSSHSIRIRVILPLVAIILLSSAQLLSTDVSARPTMELELVMSTLEVTPGQEITARIHFNNTGSASPLLWINLSVPVQLTYLSDNGVYDGGKKVRELSWVFYCVNPGNRNFDVRFEVSDDVVDRQKLTIVVQLEYTDELHLQLPSLERSATITTKRTMFPIPLDLEAVEESQSADAPLLFQGNTSLVDGGKGSTPSNLSDMVDVTLDPDPAMSLNDELNMTLVDDIEPALDEMDVIIGRNLEDRPAEPTNKPGNVQPPVGPTETYDFPNGGKPLATEEWERQEEEPPSIVPIQDDPDEEVQPPSRILSDISSEREFYVKGDTLAFLIYFNNTGSGSASKVWVNLTIPTSVRHVGDTSESVGGSTLNGLSYLFYDVQPGDHGFLLYLEYEGDIEESAQVDVWVLVTYMNSDGKVVKRSAEKASCVIIAPQEDLPALQVTIAILSSCILSLVLAYSTNESVKYTVLPFLVPLYSRLNRKEILEHEIRGIIRNYIIENPGDHFNSIKTTLDLRNGTLAHHIHILEREGIVKSVKDGKYRRFFPVGTWIKDKTYPTEIEKEILDVVRKRPGINQKSIAKRVGKSKSTVNYHIRKLKELERIRTEKNGIFLRHYVVDAEISNTETSG